MEKFLRNEMLFGKEALEKLKNARVAVFGIGGVGGYALEALVRAGVGEIDKYMKRSQELIAMCREYLRGAREKLDSFEVN